MGWQRGAWTARARQGPLVATVILAVFLAACGGSTDDAEEPAADDSPEEGEEEVPAEPVDDEQESEGEEEAAADQEASADDGPVDLASAQAELDPWAVFDAPPRDVEVPDAPGQAILQIGDQRIEMATGQCRGGPVYPVGDEPLEDARAAVGVFRFEGGASEPDGDVGVLWLLTEGVTAEGIEGEVMIRRASSLEIIVPDPDVLPATIRYQEFPDGRVNEGLEAPNTSFADAPILAVSRDGVVMAQGTVERSASEFIDAPVEVSFAARCSAEWVEAIDELEAEYR
jgi:hypothetical protein